MQPAFVQVSFDKQGNYFLSIKALSDKGGIIIGNSGAVPKDKVADTVNLLLDLLGSTQANVTLDDGKVHPVQKK